MSERDDARAAIRDFLGSRRARVSPGDVGIPSHGRARRVAGLRRQEVALLAGISPEYYTRIERGDAIGASPSVVNAIARVLQLSDVEREHFRRLMLAPDEGDVHTRAMHSTKTVRPELQRLLDTMCTIPAYIANGRNDIVAWNLLARGFYAPMFDVQPEPPNGPRFMFLHEEAARAFWDGWDVVAERSVAQLRAVHTMRPHDEDMNSLLDELRTGSATFDRLWAQQDVHRRTTGIKIINHPEVGRLEFPYETMELPLDPDLRMYVYNPACGTPAYDSLRLLELWTRDTFGTSAPTRGLSASN